MNPLSASASRAASLRLATCLFLRDMLVLTVISLFLAWSFSACTKTLPATAVTSATAGATKAAAAISTTAQTVVNVSTALPATLKQQIAAYIAAHPEFQTFLMSAANGIESFAAGESKVITDAQLINGVLPWLEQIPGYGGFFAGLSAILTGANAVEQLNGPALVELGELIKSYAA